MTFFDDMIVVRVRKEEKEAAEALVKSQPDVYNSVSDVARAGLIMILRERAGYHPKLDEVFFQ